MNNTTPYLLLKTAYKVKSCRDNYDNLFPSQRANAALCVLQILEIPYLLMLPAPKALFYVKAFSILLFSSLLVVMGDRYFFLTKKKEVARHSICIVNIWFLLYNIPSNRISIARLFKRIFLMRSPPILLIRRSTLKFRRTKSLF